MRKIVLLLVGVFALGIQLLAQTRTVTGRVTDAQGIPVPNASVLVRGTNQGTVTSEDGNFTLNVPANARVLVVSAVGLSQQEITLGTQTNISIVLQSQESSLQEVVVVGYGTQRRREVTGAISKVDVGNVANLITPSIDKQLGGRAAGVLVTNPSGLVNQPPRIRIRGVNSISGSSDPLIVLDGIPIPAGGYAGYTNDNLLANINPADIESVEVLKDGSASAIYGSRASNGVILITTKKGRAGRLNLNYNATFGFSQPYNRFDLLNAQEFVTIANEKLNNANAGGGRAAMNSENTDTDWQDFVFRDPARAMNHNFSLDGGTDRTTYFLSLNYSDQQGLVRTNWLQRYNVRGNLEQRINKWLKVSNYITLSRTYDSDQNNGGNSLSGAIANSLRALPNVRVMNPDLPQYEFFNVTPDGAALGSDANTRIIENNYTNIGFVLDKNKMRSTKHRIINNFGIEINPISWITYTFRGNVDYTNLNEYLSWDPRHGDGRSTSGRVQNQAGNLTRWVLQNYINANRSFDQHNFFLTLGTENQNQVNNSFQAIGTNISDPFFQQNNVITGSYATQQSSGGYSEGPGFVSYFARLNYDFGNKYYIQGTFRRDGLSKFAPDKRFGNFPGVSVGYRISQEDFWRNSGLSVMNEFKIRGSWARVGNIDIVGGNFPYLSLYSSAPYGAVSGIAASQQGNADLTWETNEKFDIGVDISLMNNRLNFNADYYINRNNNLVLAAPQPPSLGVPGNQIFFNIGDMENKGIELAANYDIFRGSDLNWNFGVNFTTLNNEVQSLYKNQDVIISNGVGNYNILRVGEPINAIYGYDYVGVNSSNGNPVYRKADGRLVMGNIANSTYYIIDDVNSSTLGAQSNLAADDRKVIGNSLPTYFGGITNTVSYKQFSLDMLWRFSGGNKIFNITRGESLLNQEFMNNGREILERWQKPGDVTNVPRLWYGRSNFTNLNQQASTRFIESGDFIRLDNLQLSYGVPSAFLNRVTRNGVKSLNVYVQGQNLVVITDFTGIDPDNIDVRGLNYNVTPAARTISFGLNVGF